MTALCLLALVLLVVGNALVLRAAFREPGPEDAGEVTRGRHRRNAA